MHNILVGILEQREVQALEHGGQSSVLVQCDPELAVDIGLNGSACKPSLLSG